MLTGCKILQVICAIIIVLLILSTIMLLIGAIGLSGNAAASAASAASDPADPSASANAGSTSLGMAGYGTAGILIWAAVNVGITYIFMKIFRDCADVQRVLEKTTLSRKPKELENSIKNMQALIKAQDKSGLSLATNPVQTGPSAPPDE